MKPTHLPTHCLPTPPPLYHPDSQAALRSAINLSSGSPPISAIEKELKAALHERRGQDTGIAWIRSHIGIPSNERADSQANYKSLLGDISDSEGTTAKEGVRAFSAAQRR